MPESRSHDGAREARQVDNFFWHLERYFEALDIDEEEEQVQRTISSQVELIFNRLDDLEPRQKKMPELRSYNGAREARQVDNFFWHLERYFEALDIDDEEEQVNSRLTVLEWKVDVLAEELDDLIEERVVHFTKWEVQRHKDLKGQVTELQEELATCKKELTRATRLQYWVATELQRREPHDLASAMVIVERLEDFEQRERPRSPRHERAKSEGDGRSKSGSPKVTDDERNGDKGRRRHHKGEKKHEGSCKQGDSRDYKAHGGLEEDASTVQVRIAGVLVDTGATHNFMIPRVAEWLGLKPTKDGSWFMIVNIEERPTKGVVKNVNLRTGGWTWKADFNIVDMDELGVVLEMEFMEKSSITLNPYCGVMMMAGKKGQPKWMIPLVSKDGANARKGITVL
ncbi:hypothetical protein RJ639_029691 [Escallonia herrerae]|uniref:Uncharacterized protein n=1 Tax=Escallonia herrerae TaxID=1293975 RepID=A0AA88X270_9ASTE|nr:hypothetical protein RJ639_029691 [Escallonia herrerae]